MSKRLCCPAVLIILVTVGCAPSNVRGRYNFNPGWKVFVGDNQDAQQPQFDDSSWKAVTLPYAWNEDEAFARDIHQLSTGVAWYRKHFVLPPDSAGKKVFLEFEGIRHGGEFFLNGKPIGLSENGVMAFGFDITDAALPAPQVNVLAARIDNSWNYHERATNSTFQWSDRNFYCNYGGINKNVWLHITDKLHQTLPLYSNLGTTGVYVYATDFDIAKRKATVHVESQIRNEYDEPRTCRLNVRIENHDGRAVQQFKSESQSLSPGETKIVSASALMDDVSFWSWGYGYLYNVITTIEVDGKPVDEVSTRTGFRKTEFGQGVTRLNDRVIQFHGYAQRTTNEWPAVGIDLPAWVSDFSNRMMVDGNANLVRWMHVTPSKQDVQSCDRVGLPMAMPAGDAEGDVSGRRWEQRLEVMRDAIIYNRNNPSILFYESGNKGVSEEHMRQMIAIRDQYDPHGGRASGSREMLDSTVAEYGGEMLYINKSAGMPMWAMEYSRDEGERRYWDDFSPPFHKDSPAYNRNQDSHAIENVARWFDYSQRPGTGRRVSDGGVNIIFSDSNSHFRGDDNYRRSGEVDAVRLPKDGYFANQIMWNGWVDPDPRQIHIIGHWNYKPGTTKDVYVVSSAPAVELFLNGKSLGKGEQSFRFLYTFHDVAWEPGELKAVADGCQVVKRTANEPARIRLTPHTGPGGVRADGADSALVDVEVIDAKGDRCPTAMDVISFKLTGPAEWRGGIAHGPNNCILATDLPVECGVNRVLIRSSTQPGTIKLTASANGLVSASIEIASHPIRATNGLSTDMPDADLASNLTRGPTGPDSLAPTRKAAPINSATAGSNPGDAGLSYDDNERTGWKNDGDLAGAWIQYQLEHPAKVNEVTLKLANWRTRGYPIRILAGDREVYRGTTPRNLGYVTLSFDPVLTSTIKIQLTGAGSDADAFGNIVEVDAQKNPATTTAPSTRPSTRRAGGILNIIEAEVYEPLK